MMGNNMKRLFILSLSILWISCVAFAAEPEAFQYYYQGKYSEAYPMLQKLAENNNSKALYFLAKMNLFGYGMPKNSENGLKYMQQAADLKNLRAQMYLGAYYLHHKKNIEKALEWLKKAADQGNPNAQMFTALCYLNGLGATKNANTAKHYIIKAAQNGIPMAQFLLANMFLQKLHYRDKKMGRIWMLKAAKNNYPDAALAYGVMLYTGKNSAKNRIEGSAWIERAINLGNENAKTVLEKLQSTETPKLNNILNTESSNSVNKDAKPWDVMMNLLNKAGIVITNPKRMLAKGEGQTEMPTLQSLPKNIIIQPDFDLASPNNISMSYILTQINRVNYQQQTQNLQIITYKYAIPQQVNNYQTFLQPILRQAKYGHPQALFNLALLYESGDGVIQDQAKALALLMKAAKSNQQKAEYMIGLHCLKGWGINKNTHVAIQWLRRAALHGDAAAQLLLGNIYEHGLYTDEPNQTVGKDLTRARAMYSLAAQNKEPAAQYQLAQMYTSGIFNPTNNHAVQRKLLQTAYRLYASAAKAGFEKAKVYLAYFYAAKNASEVKHKNAYEIAKKFAGMHNRDAELLLALLYDRGIGVSKNHYAALVIYRSLAKNNNALANFALGTYSYLHNRNDKRAKEYLTKAAEQGIAYAQYNLAIIAKNNQQFDNEFLFALNEAVAQGLNQAQLLLADYYLGKQDDDLGMQKAAHIYQQLARKQQYPSAELKLGYMYQNGIYFPKNMTQALYWYQQAADHDNKIAQYQLGEMYLLGQGVKRDIEIALNYYKKSAKQQFAPAMAAIGYIKAVDQLDYQNAKKWYQKAAELDNELAKQSLRILEKNAV